MTPDELQKGFNALDPMRRAELIAYLQELREEIRATKRSALSVTA